jgi:multicomponent Na+:H+ antiporter subunit E
MEGQSGDTAGQGWEHPAFLWIVRPAILFTFWLLLSGHFELHFLVVGIASSLLATGMTNKLMRPARPGDFAPVPVSGRWLARTLVRFAAYVPYLVWQIVKSNLSVAYVVLHPRMPISPRLVEFETSLAMEPAQVLLAQSITLTPGTVTVDVWNGRFLVHALFQGAAEGVTGGGMPDKVAGVFGNEGVVRSEAIVSNVDNLSWFYKER